MERFAVSMVVMISLMVTGCAANEPFPDPGQRADAGAQGARDRYFEEIGVPAALGLRRGVECDGR